ncbi:PLP-dependent aminotransferase family protein [Castellaniella sp.]|uniref:aminotransferase-like domain-containing protein n=1 Tax=Castellaniella sp. TaxID=1955812 RepID=UPI0035676A29
MKTPDRAARRRRTGQAAQPADPAPAPRQALIGTWAPRLEPDGIPKYVAVSQAIQQGVERGDLAPGLRLPPQRDIARYLGVTIATLTKAINLATHQGLVHAKPGSGTFIAMGPASGPPSARTDTGGPLAESSRDLSLNAPPASLVHDILHDNLQELAAEGPASNCLDYDPIPGDIRHRQAACHWLAMRGLTMAPEQVLITQGAHEGLLACLSALTQPGDTVLCEQLNYTGLRRIGQLLRIRLVGIRVHREGLCPASLRKALQQHSPKAIVCTPVMHNPTTATYSTANRRLLCQLARSANVPIIEDDIYGLLGGDTAPPPLMAQVPDHGILVTSLSKTVAAGLRIGYLAAGSHWIPQLRDALFNLGWTAPTLQMHFATRLIESGRARLCIDRHRGEARRRVDLARRILGEFLHTPGDASSYHVWVDTGQIRPDDLSAELYREGIQVSPASHFLVADDLIPDGATPHALRLSLGRSPDLQTLELPLQLIAHRISSGKASALGSIA